MKLDERHRYLTACTRCNNCKWTPTTRSENFASSCPSFRYGEFHSYSASGKLITGYALSQQAFAITDEVVRSVYACTMCGACDVGCKTIMGDMVEPLDSLYALRQDIADAGKAPAGAQAMMENLRRAGNPGGLPAQRREDWLGGAPVARLPERGAEIWLHIGDAAFDETQWPGLRHAMASLASSAASFAIAGAAEPDCGALAFDLGFADDARRGAEATVRLAQASGVKMIVTLSGDALAAFRGIYPRFGLSFAPLRVLHITEYLMENLPNDVSNDGGEVVTYHDSCKLGRLGESYTPWSGEWDTVLNSLPARRGAPPMRSGAHGVYAPPRALLAAAGAKVVEMERNRAFAYCCGAAAGAPSLYPEMAQLAACDRLQEAEATGAATLVTSCAGCATHLAAVARAKGFSIRIAGLMDYLKATGKPVEPNIEPDMAGA